jgi:hypothetical protein
MDMYYGGYLQPGHLSCLYKNNGNETFTKQVSSNFLQLGFSSASWSDFDNDGYLDLAVIGTPSSGSLVVIYRNNGDGTFSTYGSAALTSMHDGSITWGDYNNDGFSDLFMNGGWPENVKLYKNINGVFSEEPTTIPGTAYSSSAWGDFDNDGKLDLIISGMLTGGAGKVTQVYKNNTLQQNTQPAAPSGLTALVTGSQVSLSWNKALDAETPQAALSYNIRIGTTPGGVDVFSPMSNPANGYRKIPQLGNTSLDTAWTVKNLTARKYYWSVQAIDNGFLGSAFAMEDSFEVFTPDPPTLISPANASVNVSSKPTFTWRTALNASSYTLQFSPEPGFTSPNMIEVATLADTVFTAIHSIFYDTTYYWRVCAVNAYGDGYWSPVWNFNTRELLTKNYTSIPGTAYGSIDWGDFDNDGDKDLLLTGYDLSNIITKIYRNDGNDVFTDVNAGITGVFYSAAVWGDYNNDGFLDFLLTGGTAMDAQEKPINGISLLYKNNQDGSFSPIAIDTVGVYYSTASFVDYDNDGDLDVFFSGKHNSIFVSRLLRNDGNDVFTVVSTNIPALAYASSAWGDFDNDGDMDLLFNGASTEDFQGNPASPVSKIFRNDGNGVFADINANLISAGAGSVGWGDYDNDGDIDVIVNGANIIGFNYNFYTRVYSNNGNGTFSYINYGMQGLFGGSARWADMENDGDLDVSINGAFISGTTMVLMAATYRNDANTSLTMKNLMATYNGTNAWCDYDNDGDLDLFLTGIYTDVNYPFYFYKNNGVGNGLPTVPQNLVATQSGIDVELSWNASVDAETPAASLSYNVRIGSQPSESDIMTASSDPASGYHRLAAAGNVQHNTLFPLRKLPIGTYYWSVQSIDNMWAGSAFATEQSFDILPVADFIARDTICSGLTDTITYQGNALPTATYSWFFDNASVLSGSGQGPYVIRWNNSGHKNIKLYVSQNGYNSDTLTRDVVVFPSPDVQLADDMIVCPGTALTLEAAAAGSNWPFVFTWHNGNQNAVIDVLVTADTAFFVSIIDSVGCMASDTISVVVLQMDAPSICLVTVDSATQRNMIVWQKPDTMVIEGFNVYKETASNVYDFLAYVPYANPAVFVDNQSNPEIHSNRYKIATVDSCGNTTPLSPYHETINLTVSQGVPATTMVLQWNTYKDESNDFIPPRYFIYRGSSPSEFNLLDSVSGSVTSYNDMNVYSLYYYVIGIQKNEACNLDGIIRSLSNQKDNSNLIGSVTHNGSNTEAFRIFPNPFNETTTIQFYNPLSLPYTLVLTDATGRRVQEMQNITGSEIIIKREGMEAGVYFLEISGERIFRGKLVVE